MRLPVDCSGKVTGATEVDFGSVPADDFTVASDGYLTVTVPAQAAGTVDVTVTTYNGTSSTTSADQYTYTTGSAPTKLYVKCLK